MAGPGLRLPAAPDREPEYGHDALVVCDNLVRIYQTEGIEVQALQGLDLLVHDGEMIAIVGASGSGKSTLLQVLAGVDAPTAGRARVAGHDLLDLSRAERVRYRRHVVGFVRQQSARNLVPYLTADPGDRPADDASPGTPRRVRAERSDAAPRGPGRDALRRPAAGPDVRRRAAAGGDRRRAGQPAAGAARRRADRRAGQRDRAGGLRRAADGEPRPRRDRHRRHPRRRGERAGGSDRGHPRRPDQQRGAAQRRRARRARPRSTP